MTAQGNSKTSTWHVKHEWLLMLLTTCLVLLTALQASGSMLTRNFVLVNQSRSYSIFFLRVISELAGLSLAATLAATLERLKWAMVMMAAAMGRNDSLDTKTARKPARLVDFLALDESTTALGLLLLLFAPSVTSSRARLLSLCRLVILAVVPVTGILIMSRVDVRPVFTSISIDTPYKGFGIHPMNSTTAGEYLGFTDMLFGSKFSSFVDGPSRSIDLTPEDLRSQRCGLNAAGLSDNSGCHREYFVAGEAIFIMPETRNDLRYPDAGVFLVENHRGLLVRYGAGDPNVEFNETTNCRVYSGRYWGFQIGAIQLCVANTAPNEVHSRLVKCTGELVTQQACMTNSSWHSNPGWLIKMSTAYREASVAYSRANSTILWHSFNKSQPETPSEVSATGILKAYDSLLLDTTTLLHKNGTQLPLFSGTSFPTMLWLSVPDFTPENARNPEVAGNWFSAMQSMLVLPLYYCQNGMLRRLIPSIQYTKLSLDEAVDRFLSPLPPRTTDVSFAYQRFETVADTATLVAYAAISGVALLLCVASHAGLAVAAAARRRREGYERFAAAPQLTSFGAVDLFTHCTIVKKRRGGDMERSGGDDIVYKGDARLAAQLDSSGTPLAWLSSLGIRWAGSAAPAPSHDTPPDAEEMQSFSWIWETSNNSRDRLVHVSSRESRHGLGATGWAPPASSPSSLGGNVSRSHIPEESLAGPGATSFLAESPETHYWGIAR
ncbi:hypothetical protein B0T24DRAFT_697447, partial [Lasiosphaeria ovina]